MTMAPVEIVDAKMQGLIPRRARKNGKKPGGGKPTIKTADIDAKLDRWWFPKEIKQLTEADKKTILGCITQQLVKVVFGSHYYVWNNQIFKQTEGCPMGL